MRHQAMEDPEENHHTQWDGDPDSDYDSDSQNDENDRVVCVSEHKRTRRNETSVKLEKEFVKQRQHLQPGKTQI